MCKGEEMILVDGRVGSKDLLPYIHRFAVKGELAQLDFGDACFEGNGPDGRICIGIERKTMGDMLNCVDDARYAGHQRPGMLAMYQKSVLIIEGVWKPDPDNGYLLECVAQMTWRPFRYRTMNVRYSKLFRYLFGLQMAGTTVIQTRNMEQTAFNICEMYHWFQKKWDDHTSLLEVQKLNMPSLTGKPSLVRRWASQLDGIGVKHSMEAERIFRTPSELARGDESDWMRIPGVGSGTARSIIKQIHER
jgi:ERCC4-type nuclease